MSSRAPQGRGDPVILQLSMGLLRRWAPRNDGIKLCQNKYSLMKKPAGR